MEARDLKIAQGVLKHAIKDKLAKKLPMTLRSLGLVRCAEYYRGKQEGEEALVQAWLLEAGVPGGNPQELERMDRARLLQVSRRAFAIAEALHIVAQIAIKEEKR